MLRQTKSRALLYICGAGVWRFAWSNYTFVCYRELLQHKRRLVSSLCLCTYSQSEIYAP